MLEKSLIMKITPTWKKKNLSHQITHHPSNDYGRVPIARTGAKKLKTAL